MTYPDRITDLHHYEQVSELSDYFLLGVNIKAFCCLINSNKTLIAIEVRRRDRFGIELMKYNLYDPPDHCHTLKGVETCTEISDALLIGTLRFIFKESELALDNLDYKPNLNITFIQCSDIQ